MPRTDGKTYDFHFAGHTAARRHVDPQQQATRDRARRWLVRNGHRDLLDMLGLEET